MVINIDFAEIVTVVTEGCNITLNCTLNGSNITWTRRGESPRAGQIFSRQNITRHQSGVYTCHDANNLSEEHNVTVQCMYCICLPF